MVRKVLLTMLLGVLVAAAAGLGVKLHADRHFFDGYDSAAPLNAEVVAKKTVEGTVEAFDIETPARYRLEEVRFEARPGEPVPTLVTLPLDGEGPFPVVVFLHGSHQEKEFLEEICPPFCEAGFAMACFDQYMQGERKVKGGPLAQAKAFRARPRKTINEARRLIDYLQQHPEIDKERIYLVGASYGAITGTTVAAFDERVRGTILIYGGANINTLLEAPMIRDEVGAFWLTLLKPVVAYIMDPADPKHYAEGTSPRPVFLQAGDHDTLVHPPAAQTLIDAVGEPKKVQWYNSDHIGMLKEERHVVEEVLEDALEWLLQLDAPFRDEPVPEEVEVNAEV